MAETAHDFKDLVKASRTYRRFDASRPLTEQDVLDLVDTARFAPTGNNLQPLRFHVVTDQELVAQIAVHHGWAALLRDFNGPSTADELPTAYLAICVPEGKETNPINLIDVGIAAQTVALAAAARGIGSCMIRSYKPDVNELLGLTEAGYVTSLLIALGYPAADEDVRLEHVDDEHKLAYWRSDSVTHHVPKLDVSDLLV